MHPCHPQHAHTSCLFHCHYRPGGLGNWGQKLEAVHQGHVVITHQDMFTQALRGLFP